MSDSPRTAVLTGQSLPAQALLQELRNSSLILLEDWEMLPEATRAAIEQATTIVTLLPLLVEHRLLTEYQATRIHAGKLHGLILVNYRVRDRIGAGGMGVVYRAEHLQLRRPVAIKVLRCSPEHEAQ